MTKCYVAGQTSKLLVFIPVSLYKYCADFCTQSMYLFMGLVKLRILPGEMYQISSMRTVVVLYRPVHNPIHVTLYPPPHFPAYFTPKPRYTALGFTKVQ